MNKEMKNIFIVILSGLLLLGPCFAIIPDYLAHNTGLETAAFLQMLCFLVALSAITGIVSFLMRSQNISLKSTGLFVPAPWYANIAAVATGIIWALFSVFSLKGMDPQADIKGMWLRMDFFRVVAILVGPFGACLEDFVMRGFFMSRLNEMKIPKEVQMICSSLLFGLYHSIWMVPIIGVYFLYGLVSSFIYGLLLSGLYFLGKRSLTPVMISHGLTVFLGEPVLTYVLLKSFMF
ncbi:MAG: CPBP family intramembrane metalloprotease [Spirochaetales bacterium]|nr:CPBP family intramembrane metalloprotease [Spirochaetales bacterium]